MVIEFFDATVGDGWASRSITVLHPELRLARFLIMQAVIRGMSGISALQSRKASPVHICCASGLKASLDVDNVEKETTNAAMNAVLRIEFVMIEPRC
jgi:hypothetical protein